MDVHYSKELPQTFVIGSSELEEVVALLEEHIGGVYIRVECADDLSRDFETVQELIAYRNPKSKEILRIYISALSDNHSKSALIAFVHSTWSGILIRCKGPEDTVSRLKENILDIIAGMRSWYNIVYNFKFSMTISLIFGTIIGLCIPSALGYKVGEIGEVGLITFLRGVAPISLIAAITFVLFWFLLQKPYKYLFPKAVFVIGQGKSRFEHQQRVRWCVIIGFFVSLAAGLVPLIWSVIIT